MEKAGHAVAGLVALNVLPLATEAEIEGLDVVTKFPQMADREGQ